MQMRAGLTFAEAAKLVIEDTQSFQEVMSRESPSSSASWRTRRSTRTPRASSSEAGGASPIVNHVVVDTKVGGRSNSTWRSWDDKKWNDKSQKDWQKSLCE